MGIPITPEHKLSIMAEIRKRLTAKQIDEEFEYFKKWARRFDNNLPEQRYGILPQGAVPKEENMIYADDVVMLRIKHLFYKMEHGANAGEQVRIFLNWLEKLEGKQ